MSATQMTDSQVLARATGITTDEAREIIEREDARSVSARANLSRAIRAARAGENNWARVLVSEARSLSHEVSTIRLEIKLRARFGENGEDNGNALSWADALTSRLNVGTMIYTHDDDQQSIAHVEIPADLEKAATEMLNGDERVRSFTVRS